MFEVMYKNAYGKLILYSGPFDNKWDAQTYIVDSMLKYNNGWSPEFWIRVTVEDNQFLEQMNEEGRFRKFKNEVDCRLD